MKILIVDKTGATLGQVRLETEDEGRDQAGGLAWRLELGPALTALIENDGLIQAQAQVFRMPIHPVELAEEKEGFSHAAAL